MRLAQPHNSGYEFGMLAKVDSGIFFNFFSISFFNIGLSWNSALCFFFFFFKKHSIYFGFVIIFFKICTVYYHWFLFYIIKWMLIFFFFSKIYLQCPNIVFLCYKKTDPTHDKVRVTYLYFPKRGLCRIPSPFILLSRVWRKYLYLLLKRLL